MSTSNVFPLWKKSGCIPAPKMPGDRVSLGLLQALLSRQVGSHRSFSTELLESLESTIQDVINDETSIDISESEKHYCVDILADCPTGIFGYTLYLPKGWIGHLCKKDE